VTAEEVEAYLADLGEPRRRTLEALRASILRAAPTAEQGMSYGCPVFRVGGRPVAGFSAAKGHLSYLPHSGNVLADRAEDVSGYAVSKGALRFPVDQPLPDDLVATLVQARLAELDGS
jgi:uncharacterized protein YdhG (YjbR/CyaY superfamily)